MQMIKSCYLRQGLQYCLKELEGFCNSTLLEVNLKKTKNNDFAKNKTHKENEKITIYLGITMITMGNFTQAQEKFREKAKSC